MYVWLVLILVIAASILLAIGTIWFVNRIVGHSAGREYNSTLSPFVTTVALVYGTLLGFTVVVAWDQFSSAGANVANEVTSAIQRAASSVLAWLALLPNSLSSRIAATPISGE